MKFVLFVVSLISVVSMAAFADDSFKVGHFNNPTKEVIECSGTKLVKGPGAVLKGSKTIDLSIPGKYGPNTAGVRSEVLLETDGLKLVFETYDAGITLFVVPNDKDAKNDDNWLAHASTSLGPIRDSRDEKLFMIYKIPGTNAELMASCSYVQYEDAQK